MSLPQHIEAYECIAREAFAKATRALEDDYEMDFDLDDIDNIMV